MLPDPATSPVAAVVLIDGNCTLCQRTQRFVQQRDRGRRFRFIALQSPEGLALLDRHRLPANQRDCVVLIESDAVSQRSTAILRICRRLNGAWPLLYAGIVLPRFLRDRLYDTVARRRHG